MMRAIGTTLAIALTTVSAAGIITLIVYDFTGEDGFNAIWKAATSAFAKPAAAESSEAFRPDKEIHFFEQVPVEESDFIVSTGAAYGSVEAVKAKRPLRQWCYINLQVSKPGIAARIDLGEQTGSAAPVLISTDDISGISPSAHGLTAERLVALARSHCKFGALNPFE